MCRYEWMFVMCAYLLSIETENKIFVRVFVRRSTYSLMRCNNIAYQIVDETYWQQKRWTAGVWVFSVISVLFLFSHVYKPDGHTVYKYKIKWFVFVFILIEHMMWDFIHYFYFDSCARSRNNWRETKWTFATKIEVFLFNEQSGIDPECSFPIFHDLRNFPWDKCLLNVLQWTSQKRCACCLCWGKFKLNRNYEHGHGRWNHLKCIKFS